MAYLSINGVYVSSDYGNIFNPTTVITNLILQQSLLAIL